MSSRIAFPFLVLTDEAIQFGGWLIGDPGRPLAPAQEVLENWDYARDLEVASTLAIDWAAASEALQLPVDKLRLKLLLIGGTGVGTLPRRQYRLQEKIIDATTQEVQLSSVISGKRLSGRLRLSLQITLEAPLKDGRELSPETRGARLWESHHDILIEDGGDSRFPVETSSFAQIFKGRPQEQAPWYLHWRPNALQLDFSSSVRLYVNSDQKDIFARFVSGDEPTLQAMMGDVVSQMVELFLNQEDGDEILADCDEGSVGRQIRKWLDLAFPGQEIASVKAMWEQNPGAFRASILAASDMGTPR